MNDLITKKEIISFRYIERITIPVKEINIFSGSNDIGKSNILKAINLFFHNQRFLPQEAAEPEIAPRQSRAWEQENTISVITL
jgi:predicted ATP-dependent endonuclease of OLD family